MKRLSKFFCWGLALLVVWGNICGQTISNRENDDFQGFVKSVKEETAEVIFKNGKPTERKLELKSIKTYDIAGKYLTEQVYSDNGDVLYVDTYNYDSNKKLIDRITKHSKYLNLCDKHTYSYNDNGRQVEESCFVDGKGVVGKTVSRYDTNGRITESERIPLTDDRQYFSGNTLARYQYHENGRISNRTTFVKVDGEWKPQRGATDEYDVRSYSNEESRTTTSLKYDANGALKFVEVSLYDEHSNELETITYFPDGSIKDGNRYEYEFDKNGNATRETDSEWTTEDGRSFFKLSEVTYKTIEYFSAKEIAAYKASLAKPPQKAVAEKQNQITDPDEYSIYDQLLRKWLESSDLERIVVDRFSDYRSFRDSDSLTVNGVEKEISDDFLAKNKRKQSELQKEQFPDNRKIILISKSETKEIFSDKDKGWKYFYEKYPKSQGITTVSMAGFNEDKTKALVYVGTQSDWLAGAGYFVTLQKEGNGWKIISEQMIWIS